MKQQEIQEVLYLSIEKLKSLEGKLHLFHKPETKDLLQNLTEMRVNAELIKTDDSLLFKEKERVLINCKRLVNLLDEIEEQIEINGQSIRMISEKLREFCPSWPFC